MRKTNIKRKKENKITSKAKKKKPQENNYPKLRKRSVKKFMARNE